MILPAQTSILALGTIYTIVSIIPLIHVRT